MTKNAARKTGASCYLVLALSAALLLCLFAPPIGAQPRPENRDRIEQPEKVMEVTGVKPGMVIGEVGAGSGYFTFWLSWRVGYKGKIYANDIDRSALASLDSRSADESVTNIESVLGTVDDPRFPRGSLDMVFMVNAFHEFERPVELLANLQPSLKPGATVVIMDRDPVRSGSNSGHFKTREQMEEIIGRSVFELVKVETFLRDHNLYILKARQ